MTEIYWSWDESNGTATAEQTEKSYTALTTHGPTRDFAAVVWNDLIDMISAQRAAWGSSEWDESILSMAGTKMSSGDTMTAARFNSAVANIWPITEWPWAETLGRTTILKGDRCYGSYFLDLAAALNRWAVDIEKLLLGFSLQGTVDADIDVKLPDPLYMRFLLELQSASTRVNISLYDVLCIAFSLNLATMVSFSGMTLAQALRISVDNILQAMVNLSDMRTAHALLTGFSENVGTAYTHMAVIGGYPLYTAFDLNFFAGISGAYSRLAKALRTGFGLNAACKTDSFGASADQAQPIRISIDTNAKADANVVGAEINTVTVYLPVDARVSVNVGFKEPRLVLAEELDDILAGSLDEKLVTYVELDFT